MNYDGKYFVGVKAALLWGDKLLIYRRDNKPGLRFANMWDFFGGGRENDETPFECLRREVREELEISIRADQVLFSKVFPAMHDSSIDAYFMVVALDERQAHGYRFGSEGTECKFVSLDDFMKDEDVVPDLKTRLDSYMRTKH